MKSKAVVTATLLAAVPVLTSVASAAPSSHGTLSFTDYTPDATVLVAGQALHVLTGKSDTAYCHGGRVPAAPQDVTSRQLKVRTASVLRLAATASGAWGFEVDNSRGATLVGAASSAPASATALKLRVRPGTY